MVIKITLQETFIGTIIGVEILEVEPTAKKENSLAHEKREKFDNMKALRERGAKNVNMEETIKRLRDERDTLKTENEILNAFKQDYEARLRDIKHILTTD